MRRTDGSRCRLGRVLAAECIVSETDNMSIHDVSFICTASGFRDPPPTPKFLSVWSIDSNELLAPVREGIEGISPELLEQLSWKSQALLEFQDLQPILVPPEGGPFIKVHFPFYEGLAALRSSVLAALNDNVRASLPVLRTALELCLFHQWWRSRSPDDGYHAKFYSWLNGEKGSPGMSQIRKDLFKRTSFPATAVSEEDVRSLYARLCVHTHVPQYRDSLPVLSRSNVPGSNGAQLAYWVELFQQTLNVLLDVFIARSPQSLFPIDVLRKFGFSPPVGIYFDESNFIALREALGTEKVTEYRSHFSDASSELLSFATARSDLSDAEIMASWTGKDPDDEHLDLEAKLFLRATQEKAQMRAVLIAVTYANFEVYA